MTILSLLYQAKIAHKGLIYIFQGITPPDTYYPLSVSLPKEIISECKLSSLQLEGVIHAVSSYTS